jgi:MinD superfamily P-loop ATPase
MQMRDAEQLRTRWGNKPCTHPMLAKEYDRSIQTGDFRCTTCGECFSSEQAEAIRQQRKSAGSCSGHAGAEPERRRAGQRS